MTSATQETAAEIRGKGVITGKEAVVTVSRLPEDQRSQVIFEVDGVDIPADPQYVVDKTRGVTLGKDGQILSIVEHFLAACAMLDTGGYRVAVAGAPEMPILDGGAQSWVDFLCAHFGVTEEPVMPTLILQQPVAWQDLQDPDHYIVAFPSHELQLTYLVDFPHAEMQRRWLTWTAAQGSLIANVAPARTFGLLSDLPKLQAQGRALGVALENTLGLTEDGGFTDPMRLPDEPLRHKFLDLIGDLMLCGIPIRQVQAHIVASKAGHASHIPFGKKLYQALG